MPERSSTGRPGSGQPAVADRADDEVGRQDLQLAGPHGAAVAVDRGALDLDAGHPVRAEQPHRPAEEAQPQPRPAGGRRLWSVQPRRTARLRVTFRSVAARSSPSGSSSRSARVHQHGGVGQTVELAQLLGGERRLGGARRPRTVTSSTGAAASTSSTCCGMSVGSSSSAVRAQHPGDVQGHVADADDDDRPHPGQRRLDPRPVGVGVAGVPGDQVGGGQAAGQLLALDPERAGRAEAP